MSKSWHEQYFEAPSTRGSICSQQKVTHWLPNSPWVLSKIRMLPFLQIHMPWFCQRISGVPCNSRADGPVVQASHLSKSVRRERGGRTALPSITFQGLSYRLWLGSCQFVSRDGKLLSQLSNSFQIHQSEVSGSSADWLLRLLDVEGHLAQPITWASPHLCPPQSEYRHPGSCYPRPLNLEWFISSTGSAVPGLTQV